MKQLGEVLGNVNVVAFGLLALACIHQWRKRSDASIRWATLAFSSLATIGIVGLVLRSAPTMHFASWFVKTLLVGLILFPFFLYRFATAFQRPTRLVSVTAHVTTALVVVASVALPYVPIPGTPPPSWWTAYRIAILVQWTILFSIVATRLWVASRHEASVVRRRMRTLALAAAGLNGVILLSGVGPSTPTAAMTAATQAGSLLSAVLFFAGLAPPAWLVRMWRRPEEIAFQGAMGALFRAETPAELSAVLLPRAVGMVGGRGAALVTRSGEILATHGPIDAELRQLEADGLHADEHRPDLHRVELHVGTLFIWTSHYAPFFGPGEFALTQSLGVFADIVLDRCALAEQQRTAEATLTHQATHDGLTGLPNRVLLDDRVSQALARSRRAGTRVAVMFLDVDRFKVINDSLGHAVGDQLLKTFAQRLQAILRPEDTIARFGGDEFVIVTESWAAEDAPAPLAERIAERLAEPARIEGADVVATVSIGVAVAGSSCDAGSLLRDADAAMYQAKEHGRDRWVLFDSKMRDAADRRLATESALRRALDRGELRVHYQPLIEIASGRLAGVEALVRWQQDDDNLILPDDFIAVAEETGLILPLGGFVVREACRQVATWRRSIPGLAHLTLSVNLSARELLNPTIADEIGAAAVEGGLDPRVLCLEITETVLLDDTKSCARSLEALQALGVRIGVDDFGTGYSSLTYLKRLAVDMLKIDRSFVAGLGAGASTGDRAIVAGVVDLANGFGLTTVAEGVETAEQVTELLALGCEMAQGYHFCRPMSADDVAQWMRSRVANAEAATGVDAQGDLADWTRILLVDDQSSMLDLLRWTFEEDSTFCVIGEASGGREAVALARHYQPDVVLLDLAMPGIGGLEALPMIRAVAPEARVVVLSGLDPVDVADRARAAGAVGYLCKGADPARFLHDLRNILATAGSAEPAPTLDLG
jgi:diguanylate cyclase (GGDEF)-like protein